MTSLRYNPFSPLNNAGFKEGYNCCLYLAPLIYTEDMIELRLWQTLDAFSKEGTLMKASQTLMISQPALSRMMKQLEEELNCQLFERKNHNQLILTPTGKLAADYGAKLLALEEEARNRIQYEAASTSLLSFGACAPLPLWTMQARLPSAFTQPVTTEMVQQDDVLFEGLQSGKYQLVITRTLSNDPDLKSCFWCQEDLSLVVPDAHPLASKDFLVKEDFDNQSILLYENIGIWAEIVRRDLPATHFLRMQDYDAFQSAAFEGAFPFFISNYRTIDGIANGKILPIESDFAHVRYYLSVRKKDVRLLAMVREALGIPTL